tara:strand:- start:1501 stop:3252 length:1752 start_codon:yes stop_codon:yes gene_type:complete
MRNNDKSLNRPVFYILKDIWSGLTLKRKLQAFFVFCLMISSSIAEIASLGIIFPYLSYLQNKNQGLIILKYINIQNSQNILAYITILLIAIILIAGFLRIITLYYNFKISAFIANDISCSFFNKVINQDYIKHIYSNSNVIINSSTDGTNEASNFIVFTLQLLTSLLISVGILITLFLIDWKIAGFFIFVFSSVYLGLSLLTRKTISNNSKAIVFSREKHIQVVQEGLGSIREIIMNQQQKFYSEQYKKYDLNLRVKNAQNNTLAASPRFALEAFGISCIALVAYVKTSGPLENNNFIPLLGSIAFAFQKLLPGLQSIYASITGMRSIASTVEKVLKMTKLNKFSEPTDISNIVDFNFEEIKFKNVSFRYNSKLNNILKSIDFVLNKGDVIGIIGTTGSGKSTFLDMMMGLLKPSQGEIFIDQKNLYKKNDLELLLNWRSIISHVPQDIFLLDDSFFCNIALGIPYEKIDFDRVIEAAKCAQIHDYICKTKYGYQTIVGERGIQLSGGQKQRVGIARAFYRKSKILILDEATSALDQKTESRIINTIHEFDFPITLIMVAHRITSLSECDRIYRIENKKIFEA